MAYRGVLRHEVTRGARGGPHEEHGEQQQQQQQQPRRQGVALLAGVAAACRARTCKSALNSATSRRSPRSPVQAGSASRACWPSPLALPLGLGLSRNFLAGATICISSGAPALSLAGRARFLVLTSTIGMPPSLSSLRTITSSAVRAALLPPVLPPVLPSPAGRRVPAARRVLVVVGALREAPAPLKARVSSSSSNVKSTISTIPGAAVRSYSTGSSWRSHDMMR